MKVVAFVPMKLNNERLPGKNTRALDSGTPLFHLILNTLASIPSLDAVYVFCSADIADLLPPGVVQLRRDASLDTPTTLGNHLAEAFVREVEADIYVQAHATAPFLTSTSIEQMIARVQEGVHDSAMPVVKMQEFFWQGGRPLNYDPTEIPRTQDLEPMYMETTGAYVFSRAVGVSGKRIGATPALVEVSKIEALDINDSDDFLIANAVDAVVNGRAESSPAVAD